METEEYFNEGTPFKSMKPAHQQGDVISCFYYKFKNKNMNAKEKAKEIYCKYADALNIRDLQTTANPFVKQCALIAVDEIINSRPAITDSQVEYNNFWNDVKSELQSL
jgi:hypothetical protein